MSDALTPAARAPAGAAPAARTEAPVLSLRGVVRRYPSGERTLEVLKGADLDIYPGDMIGLIGPSGSGKSSLLHAAGLARLAPRSGGGPSL